jgi:hypothetical protein
VEPAEAALGDWLPRAALRLSLSPARGLARTMLAMEQVLPLRDWDLAALAAASASPRKESTRQQEVTGETEWQPALATGAPTLH